MMKKKKKEPFIVTIMKKIQCRQDALTLVRSGAYSGLTIIIWKVFGSVILFVNGVSIVDFSIAFVPVLCLYSLLTWRVYFAKGWVSSILLLIFFCLDYIILNIIAGKFSTGFAAMYITIALGLLAGCKGCWWIHQHPESISDADMSENVSEGDEEEDDDNRGLPKDFWKL